MSKEPQNLPIDKKNLLYRYWPIFILLALTIATSHRMLPFFGAVMHNDFNYLWNTLTNPADYLSVWTSNYRGNDLSGTVFLFQPKAFLISLLYFVTRSHYVISYLISYGLMFLCALTYFYVFSNLSKSKVYGLLAAFFVVLNNFTIENIVFGGYYFYFPSLMALALLINQLIRIKCRDGATIKTKDVWLIILTSLLITHPFYFIAYIILLGSYALYTFYFEVGDRLNRLKHLLLSVIGVIAIHAYWVIPFIGSSVVKNPQLVYNGNAGEAVYEGFRQVSSHVGAINFFEYFNFISRNAHQTLWHYIFYVSIPALMLLYIFKAKLDLKNKKIFIWLLLIFIIFYHLGLGPKSGLIGPIWIWFWKNVGAFSFFRSFSRMLIVLIPLYLAFFALVTKQLRWKKKYSWVTGSVLILIMSLNTVYFTGDLNGSIRAIDVPSEYRHLNNYIEGEDPQHNTVLTLPPSSFELYDWAVNSNRDLMQQGFSIKNYAISNPVLTLRSGLNFHLQDPRLASLFQYPPEMNKFNDDIQGWNIGFILVEKKIVDDGFKNRIDVSAYSDHLKSYPDLYTLIESNDQYDLFRYLKTDDLVEIDNGAKVELKKISPVKYLVTVRNLSKEASLTLDQSRHVGWILIPVTGQEKIWTLPGKIILPKKEEANGLRNSWEISPSMTNNLLPSGSYQMNKDGSYDVSLMIYFKPQLYLIIGFIITLITGVFVVFKLSRARFHGSK